VRWALLATIAFPWIVATLYTFRFEQLPHPLVVIAGSALIAGLSIWKRRAIADRLAARPGPAPIWIIFGAALLFRLVWIAISHTEPRSDFQGYLDLGEHLAKLGEYAYGGRLSNRRPPGLPFLLALFFELGLDPVRSGQIVNALASSAAIFPIDRWARLAGAGDDRAVGRFAALLWAISPAQIFFCSILATEPLFASLAALTASLILSQRSVTAGFVAGACTYVRSQGIIIPAAIGAFDTLLSPREDRFRRLKAHAITFAIALACLIPWGIRNELAMHRFTLLTLGGGVSAYIGNNPKADGRHLQVEEWPERFDNESELEQDRIGYAKAFAWISQHPIAFLALVPKKWAHLFKSEHDAVTWSHTSEDRQGFLPYSHSATHAFYVALLSLALFGAYVAPRETLMRPAFVGAFSLLVARYGQHVFFHAQPRYHAPLDPVFCVLAGQAMRRDAHKVTMRS
jgi:hypothetical protein